ncbi:DUF4363 family protein [Desulfosporosinus sp. Sb-LF]|uniref:DUF4363 family protein n=1 Tax=Desulfosporosinus sp. Sb-LF TaxID=2560027 RepID=UPI00107FCB31|nr:DUF4363 family protein [Desulfosporosinus sp. Sb-LF]TGE31957.1 DUF4363 family protein [Desulfosporosinus sp. Sb-LF]
MRTIPTIVTIIILLLGGSLASYQYIQSTSQTLALQIETVEQSISTHKWENAQKQLNIAQPRWDKTKTLWTVLLDHQEIDDIEVSMKKLEKYIQAQDVALSLGEASALKLLIDHISDTEKLTLRNIF